MSLPDYYQIGWSNRPDGIPCRACGAIAEEGEDHTEWCPIGMADAEAERAIDFEGEAAA